MKKKLLAALLASALAAGMLPTSACAASDYTTATATLVTLTDSSAIAKGKYTGYEIDGTDVSITAAGTYVFSGDCDNGSITVKKGVTGVSIANLGHLSLVRGLDITLHGDWALNVYNSAALSFWKKEGLSRACASFAQAMQCCPTEKKVCTCPFPRHRSDNACAISSMQRRDASGLTGSKCFPV